MWVAKEKYSNRIYAWEKKPFRLKTNSGIYFSWRALGGRVRLVINPEKIKHLSWGNSPRYINKNFKFYDQDYSTIKI